MGGLLCFQLGGEAVRTPQKKLVLFFEGFWTYLDSATRLASAAKRA